MDSSIYVGIVVLPGITAAVMLALFSYLQIQTRAPYFRAWQVAWVFYLVSYALQFIRLTVAPSMGIAWAAKALLGGTAICIWISTRLIRQDYRFRIMDPVWFVLALAWGWADAFVVYHDAFRQSLGSSWYLSKIEFGAGALLVLSAIRFFRRGWATRSDAFKLLGVALFAWAGLLFLSPFHELMGRISAGTGHFLGSLPQMLLGIAMVMVLYDSERRTVEENLLALSTLNEPQHGAHNPAVLRAEMLRMLEQLLQVMRCDRGAIVMGDEASSQLPTVQFGFTDELFQAFKQDGTCERVTEAARLRGEPIAVSFDVTDLGARGSFPQEEKVRPAMMQFGVRGMACAPLLAGEGVAGVIVVAHGRRGGFGEAQLRMLDALTRQIALTLQNYALVKETLRRREESELLTEIGQMVSSRLDPDEILLTVQRELSHLFDTRNFYVAFLEGEQLRFAIDCDNGAIGSKRSRRRTNGITEHIIQSGQPLLIRHDMEARRRELGVVPTGRPAKCFCGVPVFSQGNPVGVMAVLSYEEENLYSERDLEVLRTAAGQVSVAYDNARLFRDEQRRARTLAFLNTVSRMAISSQNAAQMLDEIVSEVQSNFTVDHIGIGVLDYVSKEVEIKAAGGNSTGVLGRRIPLGVGVLGRVARSNETALQQGTGQKLLGLLPDARSILCIPLTYSESLLGVLNLESAAENAFSNEDVLLLRTLSDLVAAALHNALVFQKMQQQSITDGLTGIKTRRYFLEAVHSEYRRASRSGRAFSVVLIDLDKFKEVNDSFGHLEGDLVLSRVGRLLEQKSRQSNVIARYGGDEFVILMPETGVEQAEILSERLRLWLATDPMLAERKISGSFGVATFPLHGATVEDIIRIADAGMYVSKRAGGNKVSTPDDFGAAHSLVTQRQLVTTYVEGFLQRESTGPDSLDELVDTLQKLRSAVQDDQAQAMRDALVILTRTAETREIHSAGHGDTVSKHVEAIGAELGLPREEIDELAFSARIHDIGKILIPEKILNKPYALTEEEFHLVKMHPTLGEELVRVMPNGSRIAGIVRHHHERFDGAGYPDNISGERIPLGSRIISAVEAYVNMVMERPYAELKTPAQAMEELEELSGTQFDGMIVRVFTRLLRAAKSSRSTQ
jgi:diguanylate cyclase (GGDEF)-like protein